MPTRRRFLQATAALSLVAPHVRAAETRRRVGVIGHTGRGNYGHGLDVVWLAIPEAQIVAVADADPAGLAAAAKKLGALKTYADYREMLTAEKPEFVSIAPRFLDEHRDMVLAAVDAGVRGIFCEKPMCRTLAEADQIVAACDKHDVKLVLAFQTRFCPRVAVMKRLIDEGRLGQVLEYRARGKEDRRGGSEDLWVLAPHMFNVIHYLGGPAVSCSAQVLQNGRPVTRADVKDGAEGIGPLAGDEVHATYRLSNGATASFDSIHDAQPRETRYGLTIYGTKGCAFIGNGYMQASQWLDSPTWRSTAEKPWLPVTSAGINEPEPLAKAGSAQGNVVAARELIDAVDGKAKLRADVREGLMAMEMTVAVFESHRQQKPVEIPLTNRENPLAVL